MKVQTGCDSVAIARAALQRPWIFTEIKENQSLKTTKAGRHSLLSQLFRTLIKEFTGDRETLFDFLRFHMGWYLCWNPKEKDLRAAFEGLMPDTDLAWHILLQWFQVFGTTNEPDELPPLEFRHKIEAEKPLLPKPDRYAHWPAHARERMEKWRRYEAEKREREKPIGEMPKTTVRQYSIVPAQSNLDSR